MVKVKWFKALSDETRLRIVALLSLHEWSVNDMVHILQMGQSRVSRHLGILYEAGLVAVRREGLWAYYRLSEIWQTQRWLSLLVEEMGSTGYEQDIKRARDWEEKKKRSTREFFDDIASRWKTLRHELLGEMDPMESLLEGVKGIRRCADLGCGSGEGLSFLLSLSEKVIGVDHSTEMLSLARQRFIDEPRVEFREGDIEDLPLKDGEIDLVTLNLTLHHLPNLRAWAREMSRVLKQGGYVAIVDFLPHQEERLREIYHDHWMGLDPKEIGSLLASCGFSLVKEKHHSLGGTGLQLFSLLMKKG
ncbi:MAG: metalloregulator ArsR/SmtB family transcription factor [Brevinematales bacterium]|nr:metalloregulator ArsR/SmtB family transcription factor [Brevinematales bacterium]